MQAGLWWRQGWGTNAALLGTAWEQEWSPGKKIRGCRELTEEVWGGAQPMGQPEMVLESSAQGNYEGYIVHFCQGHRFALWVIDCLLYFGNWQAGFHVSTVLSRLA